MRSFHIPKSGAPRLGVQPESRFRVSGEAAERAMVHAARRGAQQKAALHATVHDSSQSTQAIAEGAGISYQFLCAAASESHRDQLPFFRLPLVLEHCDDLTYLRFLAELQGAAVVRLPKVGAAGDVKRASATMREFAEFMEAGAGAVEDDVVSPEEFARVEQEAQEAVNAILELVAGYRARVKRPLLSEGW